MSQVFDEVRNEGIEIGIERGIKQARIETALMMIDSGEFTFEKISLYSGLEIDKVLELADNMSKQ